MIIQDTLYRWLRIGLSMKRHLSRIKLVSKNEFILVAIFFVALHIGAALQQFSKDDPGCSKANTGEVKK